MPFMTSSSFSNVYQILTTPDKTSTSRYYQNAKGALSELLKKINRLNVNGLPIGKYGNYNHTIPLPPLQAFWAQLGSMAYYAKHKQKSIPTTQTGSVIYKDDYSDFWRKNIVDAKDPTIGFKAFAKLCGENLFKLSTDPKWKSIIEAWA
jgi:hypothetical protein